eukprot:16289637-Heterocapsa_arctica.AAC.1
MPRADPAFRLGGIQPEGKGEEGKGGLSALSGEGGLSSSRSKRAAGKGNCEREYGEKETRNDEGHVEERRGNRGMGRQGRGIEGRDQGTYETQQSGAERHQGGTGNDFAAAGAMENQGEGR